MYREVLQSIDGVAVYPIVALLIFFTFFVGVVVWTVRLDGAQVRELARLPLDEDPDRAKGGGDHE
jgi:hypothetical protein